MEWPQCSRRPNWHWKFHVTSMSSSPMTTAARWIPCGELERLIAEALVQDDRIEGIEGFSLEFSGDEVLCRFTVVSAEGSFAIERRVRIGV